MEVLGSLTSSTLFQRGTQKNDSIEKRESTAVKISSRKKGGEMEARRSTKGSPCPPYTVQYSVDSLARRKLLAFVDQTKAGGLAFGRMYLGAVVFQ